MKRVFFAEIIILNEKLNKFVSLNLDFPPLGSRRDRTGVFYCAIWY